MHDLLNFLRNVRCVFRHNDALPCAVPGHFVRSAGVYKRPSPRIAFEGIILLTSVPVGLVAVVPVHCFVLEKVSNLIDYRSVSSIHVILLAPGVLVVVSVSPLPIPAGVVVVAPSGVLVTAPIELIVSTT